MPLQNVWQTGYCQILFDKKIVPNFFTRASKTVMEESFLYSEKLIYLFPLHNILIFFNFPKSFQLDYGPGIDSASNRNEYQEMFLGSTASLAHKADCLDNLGSSISHNPLGLHSLMGIALLFNIWSNILAKFSEQQKSI
jgi:hypothetical protein